MVRDCPPLPSAAGGQSHTIFLVGAAYGNANTYSAFVKDGASTPASRNRPAINPPLPTNTATYCFPFMEYVIVLFETGPPRVVSHRTFPLSASKARSLRSRAPQKTTSPAVVNVAATPGTRPS